jgi:hypothetical protein
MNDPTAWRGVRRIVSGGQTGVDRAALDVAMKLNIEHGGWCPRGRLAEDGTIPSRYALRETRSAKYHVRTEQNVVDSEGTLILYRETLTGGTLLTWRLTRRHRRPCLLVDLATDPGPGEAAEWLRGLAIQVLNVAGPRESTAAGISPAAERFLLELLGGGET